MRFRRVFAVFTTLLGGFLLLELGLALADASRSYSAIFEYDDDLGYRYASGKYKFLAGGHHHTVTINEGRVLDYFGEGPASVVIFGDGVVAGLEIPAADRLASKVGECIDESVVNLSVPGYGTVQQLGSLKQWILEHQPPQRAVFIYNYANDYYDNVPEWEGVGVPGLMKQGDRVIQNPPAVPSGLGKWIRKLIWSSRVVTLIRAHLGNAPAELQLPDEQLELFRPLPSKLQNKGDVASSLALSEISQLADRLSIATLWIGWRDVPLEVAAGVNIEVAVQRLEYLSGLSISPAEKLYGDKASQEVALQGGWFVEGTRHANRHAIGLIAKEIVDWIGLAECR